MFVFSSGRVGHRCDVMLYDIHLSDSNLTFARNGYFGATPKCATFGHLREVWRRYDACSFVGIRISSLIGRRLSRFTILTHFLPNSRPNSAPKLSASLSSATWTIRRDWLWPGEVGSFREGTPVFISEFVFH